ncbi:MAG: hypothetical protein EPN20_09620 [Magnetospirillum sp.]|nr:MAG: hypothetical protein EPN20_09620 [Magnetospirillum sp.]
MSSETNHLGHELGKGAVMAVGYVAGRSLFGRLLGHPLVMLGAGVAIGYLGFKYRKEITAAVAKAGDMGKDLVLNTKENLADLVEESREAEEAKAKE